jgi:hypothetical protein
MVSTFAGLSGRPARLPVHDLLGMRGTVLYAGDGTVVAALDRQCYWQFQCDQYVRLDIAGPLTLRLVALDGRQQVDAHDHLAIAYGCLHTPAGRLAALEQASGAWRGTGSHACYSEFVVEPRLT